ncbi:MAG: hypothetical protein FJX52_08140 [Alphaproteobacteria bacterium]|nr:hypothetical protein [Alphaproteobacteria bacterium]
MKNQDFSSAARDAIYKRDRAALAAALRAGADVNATDESGATLLRIASAALDDGDVVRALLAAGADIDARDEQGWTGLYWAVDMRNTDNVRALCAAGADVDSVEYKENTTPLFRAIYKGAVDIALLLLEHSRNVNIEAKNDGGTPLLWAVGTDSRELVQRLVEKGADIHAPGVLQSAAFNGRLEHIDYLLAKGADINARNRYGNTCMHVVAGRGNVSALKWLLERGADPLLEGEGDSTPLALAIERGHTEAAELLRSEFQRRGQVQ